MSTSRLNYDLFEATGTDSAELNVLGTLIHRFPDEGDYMIEVRQGDTVVGTRLLAVSGDYHTLQATYDLSAFGDTTECDCGPTCSCEDDFDCIREDGVAVFHVGSGPGGYAVTVDPVGERRERREFDSDELVEDDVFSALLLRPGSYVAKNTLGDASAEMTVNYPDGQSGAANQDAIVVTVTDDGFEPAEIEMDPGRGVSFIVETEARIVVELDEPHEKTTDDTERKRPPQHSDRIDITSAIPFDPSGRTPAEIESKVGSINTATELRAVLLAERRNDNRKTVVETLRNRIRDVSKLRR